jgi:hypothetical protein
MDTHLERSNRSLQQNRHLLVRSSFDMLHHERLAEGRRKSVQRAIEIHPQLVAIHLFFRRRVR